MKKCGLKCEKTFKFNDFSSLFPGDVIHYKKQNGIRSGFVYRGVQLSRIKERKV